MIGWVSWRKRTYPSLDTVRWTHKRREEPSQLPAILSRFPLHHARNPGKISVTYINNARMYVSAFVLDHLTNVFQCQSATPPFICEERDKYDQKVNSPHKLSINHKGSFSTRCPVQLFVEARLTFLPSPAREIFFPICCFFSLLD